MAVAVAFSAGEACHQNVGTKFTNHAHNVSERNVVTAPLLESLFWRFRVSEIGDTCKALLNSVIAVRGEQFKRTQDAESIRKSVASFVLSALSASERK